MAFFLKKYATFQCSAVFYLQKGEWFNMDKRQKFERAVESYSDMITALCLLRLGNMHDAEDCYQNVFLKLYKH
ncbi:MAG: hypothetical protein IJZ72_07945, partial [Oscillospiraceae bacterium]|nr:hypothetical protein [Oscillospiraceae bacterium]